MRTKPTMKKRMLRSVLATAFVVALASGAAGPLDVGWVSPPGSAQKTAAEDVGWSVQAGSTSRDVGWVVEAASPGDVGWIVADGTTGDVGWSEPAGGVQA